MPKKIDLPLVSGNPSSVRLDDDDKKAMKKAIEIIKKKYTLPPAFKLNQSNVLRIALHEFVDNETQNKA